jgi:hypothetical protein
MKFMNNRYIRGSWDWDPQGINRVYLAHASSGAEKMLRNCANYWSPYEAKADEEITHKQLQARSDKNNTHLTEIKI